MKIVQKITSPLDCPAFIDSHRQHPHDFTRRRQLTFKNLVLFLLNQPRTALQTELDQFYRVLNQASVESRVVTAQAFSKARSKLKPEVFESLNQTLQHQIDSLGLRQTWRGLRVLAMDGSSVHLPLETAMTRFFGSHSEFPVARLSMLYDVADGQTLHSLIVPSEVGERDCAHLHLDHVPADSLTLFDRGYPGHWLFALFEQQRRHFLMRLSCSYNAQVQEFLRSGQVEDTQFFAANHPEARLFCTEAGVDPTGRVELRLIRVELASGESEVLLTSLLDRQAFPAKVFADLYHRRWGIETDYRRLKQTLGLDNFSGRSVTAVKQDFHAAQLLKNLALLMQHLLQPVIEQRHKDRKLRWKMNFTQGVSRLKNTLADLLVRPCVQSLGNLLELMANSLSAVRPGRSFPRKRKRAASRGCEGYKPTR
ncbi:MAG: IS4 family transposase [Pseudomonas sp.]|uniref:IS4 family transposase n=1 Tax=Pseudomonas sp. TaxID=306 RepID=UPI003BB49FEE